MCAAVGLSGQMHGLTLLDAANRVIRPALIWCDQRSQPQVDCDQREGGRRDRARVDGESDADRLHSAEAAVGARSRAARISSAYDKCCCRRIMCAFELTGEYASEVSDASGTALFDVVNRRWSFELVDRAGRRSRDFCRACIESSDVTGTIHARGRGGTGLAEGTPVVGGGGDQAASAVGNGIVEPGMVSCTHRHVGRGVRAHGGARVRSRGPRPHVLPRGAQARGT